LAFFDSRDGGHIWMFPLDGDRKPQPLINDPKSNQGSAEFSPDGHWIVYASNESGKSNIYVQPFPPTGAKYQMTSSNDALSPRWSRDGNQIFYFELDTAATFTGHLTSVDVVRKPAFSGANPMRLPIDGIFVFNLWPYDIVPDGQHIVAVVRPPSTSEKPPE